MATSLDATRLTGRQRASESTRLSPSARLLFSHSPFLSAACACVCREDADFDESGGGLAGDGAAGEGEEGDGGEGGGRDIQIANVFYEAEDIRRENPPLALEKFKTVVSMAEAAAKEGATLNEESNTSHFNAIVHIVCLLYDIQAR